jgi:hypothetical protein
MQLAFDAHHYHLQECLSILISRAYLFPASATSPYKTGTFGYCGGECTGDSRPVSRFRTSDCAVQMDDVPRKARTERTATREFRYPRCLIRILPPSLVPFTSKCSSKMPYMPQLYSLFLAPCCNSTISRNVPSYIHQTLSFHSSVRYQS